MLFIFAYWITSLIITITSFTSAGASPGFSALGTCALSFFAGAGLKGSLYGSRGQKIAGVVAATVFMAIAHWIGAGFSVRISDIELTGTEWGWIGFFVCLIFTSKSMAFSSK